MHYKFPLIEHIDQVIPHVEGCDAFIVANKEDYTVIDYKMMNDAFPPVTEEGATIRRECRGLIFNKHGELVRRAYHKFFNMNEREETQEDKINWSVPHMFLEKIDGSMVTPFLNNDHIRWATRMGITSVAMQAECFVAKNPKYTEFAEYCLSHDITPIFEWCSPQNKIVLDYDEERLVLTALRGTKNGEYFTYSNMRGISIDSRSIPHVSILSMPDHLDVFYDAEGIEGTVIRFDDGHMVKMKTSWYVGIHKALSGLLFEKDLLAHIFNQTLDDVIPFLPEKERDQVRKYQKQVESNIVGYTQFCYAIWRQAHDMGRKQFGLLGAKFPKIARSVVFDCWENISDIPEDLINKLKKNLSSQTRVDNIRNVFGTDMPPWKLRRNFE